MSFYLFVPNLDTIWLQKKLKLNIKKFSIIELDLKMGTKPKYNWLLIYNLQI